MQNNSIKKKSIGLIISLVVIIVPWIIIFAINDKITADNLPDGTRNVNFEKDTLSKQADHSKFEVLKQQFTSPEQVTEACLTCHNERQHEIMQTAHWNWDREVTRTDGTKTKIGKRNIVNNYCIATNTNTWKCSSCHIGFGYKDKTFDFKNPSKVDCIVCHDNTNSYEKQPLGSGYPVTKKEVFEGKTLFPPDLNYIAQSVAKPTRNNCGKCHFFGGGGDNVKHGDLSSDLFKPNKQMDVHMDTEGNNMACVACHEADRHKIMGKAYSVSSANEGRMECEKCHSEAPHNNSTLNNHTAKVACQTCHIPVYAKGVATKMRWDWSTAGKLDADGKKINEHDKEGHHTYSSEKGSFVWKTNVEPEYVWFNGTAEHYVYGDVIKDPSKILQMNIFFGDYNDPKAKIVPVKIHRGKQFFDPVNKILIVPHIYGHDSTAYKTGLDWNLSAQVGMKEAGLPYSGKYEPIETEMYWRINHMVAESDKALTCKECHSRNGRLKNLAGFYMPGRDRSILFDIIGVLMISFSVMGVAVHALIRYIKRDCIACE